MIFFITFSHPNCFGLGNISFPRIRKDHLRRKDKATPLPPRFTIQDSTNSYAALNHPYGRFRKQGILFQGNERVIFVFVIFLSFLFVPCFFFPPVRLLLLELRLTAKAIGILV